MKKLKLLSILATCFISLNIHSSEPMKRNAKEKDIIHQASVSGKIQVYTPLIRTVAQLVGEYAGLSSTRTIPLINKWDSSDPRTKILDDALRSDDIPTIKKLIQNGVPIINEFYLGEFPLAFPHPTSSMKLLIIGGYKVNEKNTFGHTRLTSLIHGLNPANEFHYENDIDLIVFLLENGADPLIKGAFNMNAFAWLNYKKKKRDLNSDQIKQFQFLLEKIPARLNKLYNDTEQATIQKEQVKLLALPK